MFIKILEIIQNAAAIQGLFLAVILFLKKNTNKHANIFLSLLILACSYAILHSVHISEYFAKTYGKIISPEEPTVFLIGPLLFFYTRTLIQGKIAFLKSDLKHFLPFVVYYLIVVFTTIHPIEGQILLKFIGTKVSFNVIILSLTLILGTYYAMNIVAITGIHQKTIKEEFSNIEKVSLEWIKKFLAAYMILLVSVIVNFGVDHNGIFHMTVPLVFAVFIYSFGYRSLLQPEIFYSKQIQALEKKPSTEISVPGKEGKYKTINMNEIEAHAIAKKIKTAMDQKKLYLNPDFNLDSLSEVIGINKNYLSYVLNDTLKSNFFNFVNQYRVEEVKKIIKSGKSDHLTLIAIAFDSGFNSKASFNSTFKKITGITPSQFRKS